MNVTIKEIMDSGRWEEFCEIRGWDPWIVNEGRASSDEEVELCDDEIRALLGLPAKEDR